MRIKVNPKAPGIARQARRYETKLRTALELSRKVAARKDARLFRLLQSAVVEGVDAVLKTKTATISFRGKPLRGTLHQMYEWQSLDLLSVREISHNISWSLNHSIRDDLRER
jgi:hypothetical protein